MESYNFILWVRLGLWAACVVLRTVHKYNTGWLKWRSWVQSKLVGIPALPAVPLQVALYLTELIQRATSDSQSVSVISGGLCLHPYGEGCSPWYTKKAGETRAAERALSHDVVSVITRSLSTESPSKADIRFLFMLLVGYAAVFFISGWRILRLLIISCRFFWLSLEWSV